jgi:hypothetical protein
VKGLDPSSGLVVQRPSGQANDADKSIRLVWHDDRMAQAAEKAGSLELIAAPAIEKRIFVVRGRQVMLDEDLADLYGVETRVLVQQVKRNAKRFPADFMFQLTEAEAGALRSQIVISNDGRGGRRYASYVSPSRASRCSPEFFAATGPSP